MNKRNKNMHENEIYPGGNHSFPPGGHPSQQGRQPKHCVQTFGITIKARRPRFYISEQWVERVFCVLFFICIEILIYMMAFKIFGAVFADLQNGPFDMDMTGFWLVCKMVLFIGFTYMNIMTFFFGRNFFNF